jgi:hypothetical protein
MKLLQPKKSQKKILKEKKEKKTPKISGKQRGKKNLCLIKGIFLFLKSLS